MVFDRGQELNSNYLRYFINSDTYSAFTKESIKFNYTYNSKDDKVQYIISDLAALSTM